MVGPVLPLPMLGEGESAIIADVVGGRGIRRHLSDVGLAPGVTVQKAGNGTLSGPVIVRVMGARIAVGHGMARRIMVRPLSAGG